MKFEYLALTLSLCALSYVGGRAHRRQIEHNYFENLYTGQISMAEGQFKARGEAAEKKVKETLDLQWKAYQEAYGRTVNYYEELRKKQAAICRGIYEDNVKKANRKLLEKYK